MTIANQSYLIYSLVLPWGSSVSKEVCSLEGIRTQAHSYSLPILPPCSPGKEEKLPAGSGTIPGAAQPIFLHSANTIVSGWFHGRWPLIEPWAGYSHAEIPKSQKQLGMETLTWNPNSQEAEAKGLLCVLSQPGLDSEMLTQRYIN